MAYVLSLRPQSPLKRSFSDNPYLRPCSPLGDASLNALRDITPRNASTCSLYSLVPNKAGEWLRGIENTPPPLTTQSLLDLGQDRGIYGINVRTIDHAPWKRNCGTNRPLPSFSRPRAPADVYEKRNREMEQVTETSSNDHVSVEYAEVDGSGQDDDATEFYNLYEAIHIPLPEVRFSDNIGCESKDEPELEDEPIPVALSPQPFRRWMSTLRRRHVHRRKDTILETPRWSVDFIEGDSTMAAPLRRKSESFSSSSLACVTAIKSDSITVASASIAPRSETGGLHGKPRIGNRSSGFSDARRSTDSNTGALGPIIDESAWLRSLQRRRIVEELISSEESYIADLKVLINDYFMILTSIPAISSQTRVSIQQNISQILQLHEDLLAELHHAVPQADFTQSSQQDTYPVTRAKHIRFHSADIGRFAEHKIARRLRHSLEIGRSPDRRPRGLVTDTETVGNIARVFNKHMKRFFAYEEYGAHWTTMSQDLTNMCKGLHGWHEYERGVEALSKVIASDNNRDASSRKALSFPDLLIKPIQRVCKYPLLFDDLCRHTPVYDDPEAHADVEKALFRLQETIREVNKAKDDPKTRRLIEISWQLQDRLVFREQNLSRAVVFRLLGHVLACGVLHVAYQTPDHIKGQYMVCVLYKSCLVLATTNRSYTPYNVVASISLANASLEEPDNGRGLQCHTAPHTWKLMFEHSHRLHEVVLSACSILEEEVWKNQLRGRIVCETHDFVEGHSTMHDMFSSLSLDIKSIGPVFGHADSLVRRMSVHRAATLGSKSHMSQVIIKNTQAQKVPDPSPTFAPNLVTRSQSHMSSNHVPTLAPRRAERIRLETALEEVWTKDILPFPGMGNRRVENQIRASATSVMRKLSMASIASNFSRRSPSFSSISNTRSEDSFGSKVHKLSQGNLRARSAADRRPAPTVVDFHNAPAAFLPTDFELQDTRSSGRRRRLANRAAGTIERSSDKNTPGKPRRTRRLSAQITSLPRTDISHRLETSVESSASTLSLFRMSEATTTYNAKDGNEENENLNEKRIGKETNESEYSGTVSDATTPTTKTILKSKSRIFKFWV
ncbi:hypothetical protein K504DRAFT_462484 [Pleomassaria siparia CBS 279.74]|uniref:DH domain-containing protein n=1 Tax=Pleomassaria siparia CBS 279.74 TaxID=1314801 RepID=A0A6G1KNY1_9PLEO|nr:hypothetical protein K504DRAFT_462484 [Pleomassaria siparia CBS 279.74]